ncbi:MAG TPA: hypothetical protein VFT72_16980 [Opitutaceae bacterium]|nr:hypothetical protein [Opitutaceae bacterium]
MMKTTANKKASAPVQLTWSHLGFLYRVTAWPDADFETERDGTWIPFEPDPSSEVFAAAAVMLGRAEWNRYLDFVPAAERAIIESFRFNKLAALAVIKRNPELVTELSHAPALAMFVASHVELRGGGRPAWSEISAIYERGGIFALLEWLGLPATRKALDGLAALSEPDVARRLLSRVREALWNPIAARVLHSEKPLNDRELAARCHVLAA